MGSAGSERSEIPRTCDKTWPEADLTSEATQQRTQTSTWIQKQDGQKGSGVNRPVLRITHRVCWVEALETFLPVVKGFIYRAGTQLLFKKKKKKKVPSLHG